MDSLRGNRFSTKVIILSGEIMSDKAKGIKALLEFGKRLKTKNGSYVSKVVDGIRVGIANFEFKREISFYIALARGFEFPKAKEILSKHDVPLPYVKFSGQTIESFEGKNEFMLLTVSLSLDEKEEDIYSLFEKMSKVKKELKEHLYKNRISIDDILVSAKKDEIAWEKEWGKRLAELTEKEKMKVIVFPYSSYDYCVIFNEGNTAVRRKLRGLEGELEKYELYIPSNAEVYSDGKNVFVAKPLEEGESLTKAIQELKKVKITPKKEHDYEPEF